MGQEIPAIGQHAAPLGCGRADADAQEAQRRRRDDGRSDAHGGQDDDGRHDVGEQVAEDDRPGGAADHPGGGHEFPLFDAQHIAARQAHVAWHRGDAYRDHQVDHAGAERGDDGDRQQDARKGQQHIHEAHDDAVGAAPGVAGYQAQEHPNDHGDGHRHDAHRQRDAPAPEHARQDVSPEAVRAQQMPGSRGWRTMTACRPGGDRRG